MTDVLGAAYIDIVARTGNVKGQVVDGLKTAERAAQDSGTKMGGHIGTGLEKGSGRGKAAIAGLSGAIIANSNGALGPLQEVLDKGEGLGEAFEGGRKRVGVALLGVGTAATGIGALLSSLGSKDEAAQGRLAASIKTTGKSFDDYKEDIEKAVHGNEHYGITASQTMDALNKLTLATHDPAKAMELLGTAVNVSAARHTDLETAATSVGKVFNGNTKILKEFGIVVPNTGSAMKQLEQAHTDVERSAGAVKTAEEAYQDKLTVFKSIAEPTVAQHVALEAAHRKVGEATEANKIAQERLIEATKRAKDGNVTAQQALKELAEVTQGQASASADTFTGHLDALKAKVEDTAASYGTKFGGALITIGPALAGAGAAIEIVSTVTATLKARAVAAAAATDAETAATSRNVVSLAAHKIASVASAVASGAWTAAQWLLNAALTANPIGLVVVGVAALIAGFVLAYKHSETFRDAVGHLWELLKRLVGFTPLGALIENFDKVRAAIGFIVDKIHELISALGKIHVPDLHLPSLPHIPGFAAGVSNFSGGLALVGERGPELVRLPAGADVIPTDQTRAALTGSGKTERHYQLVANVQEVRLDEQRAMELFGRMELLYG